jgi:hypothetical protein
MSDADRLHCFDEIGKTLCARVFDDSFIGGTCKAELEPIMDALGTALFKIAEDCIRQKLKPSIAWGHIAAGFDAVATRDRITEFALAIGKSGLPHDDEVASDNAIGGAA